MKHGQICLWSLAAKTLLVVPVARGLSLGVGGRSPKLVEWGVKMAEILLVCEEKNNRAGGLKQDFFFFFQGGRALAC